MCGSNVGNCRHRYWQYSMLAPDRSPSLIKKRNDYLTYIQIIKAHGSSYNIHNRINSANLMKMNFFQRGSMSFCFCLSKNCKNFYRYFICPSGHICFFENIHYFLHSPVTMTVCFVSSMPVRMFFPLMKICHIMIMVLKFRIQ